MKRQTRRLLEAVASGAASSVAGTLALHMAHEAALKYARPSLPPMYEEPGHYVVRQTEDLLPTAAKSRITGKHRDRAATALSYTYGAVWPALYLALRGRHARVLVDGAALGVAVWGIGYLGWLPRLRLSPPVSEQTPLQIVSNVAEHALYGVLTITAWRALRALLDR